ncbi:MAG: pyrimidine-nucleoside phosphorylase, partial [bacterium]
GQGAFMDSQDDAVELARAMVQIGNELDKTIEALVTNMNQPLGRAVGNANEMIQAIEILKGNGPEDLEELVCRLAGSMLSQAGQEPSRKAGYDSAYERLQSGDGVDKLRQIIEWQSGDPRVVDDYSRFPEADQGDVVEATARGFIQSIDAYEIGMAAGELGAGRDTMEDEIDPAAGIFVERKIGDPVDPGDPIFRLEYNSTANSAGAIDRLRNACVISDEPCEPDPLIHGVLEGTGDYTSLGITYPTVP